MRITNSILRRGSVLIVLGVLLTIFAACDRRSGTPQTVVVGYLPIYVDLPLFVAKERGFFEKRGVGVNLVRFESSPDMGTALLNNSIEAAASISTSVALSTESRDPGRFKVFLVDAENKDKYLSSFVVLKSSGITQLRQLKGKTIGSFPGPGAATFGKLVLEKAGLNPGKDVTWVELATPNHLSALETRTVDALFTYEPTATQAVLEKDAIKIAPGAVETYVMSPWQAGVWGVSEHFRTERPEVAKRFILAIYDAVDYMRSHPSDAKLALASYTSIKTNIAQATPDIPFTKLAEVDAEALQRQADILTDRRVLSKKVVAQQMLLAREFLPAQ